MYCVYAPVLRQGQGQGSGSGSGSDSGSGEVSRVRLSCSLKSGVLSSMHHDALNVGLSRHTCHHHPFTHNAWCLRRFGPELSSCRLAAASVFKVEQRLFERCEAGLCVVACAKSVTMELHGNVDHCQPTGAKLHSFL